MKTDKERLKEMTENALVLYEACAELIKICDKLAKTNPDVELPVPLALAVCGIKGAITKVDDKG